MTKQSIPLRQLSRWAYHTDPTAWGITPLHQAAYNGQFTTLKKLLDSNIDPNTKDNIGFTPLHDAILSPSGKGNQKIIKLLINYGADVNIQDQEDLSTPLNDAVNLGNTKAAKLLLKANANINIKDKWNLSPLENASKKNYSYIESILKSPKNIS